MRKFQRLLFVLKQAIIYLLLYNLKLHDCTFNRSMDYLRVFLSERLVLKIKKADSSLQFQNNIKL